MDRTEQPRPLTAVYAALAGLGTVLPLSQFLPWVLEHGLDPARFVADLFSNPIGGFFGWDVIVSALAVLCLTVTEGRRLHMSALWLPVAGTLLVGVSLGLPLFLCMRERHLAAQQ